MNIITSLNKMEVVEALASELYKKFHFNFSYDPDVQYFFYKMYIEEKGHRNLVQYVKRLVHSNPKLFADVDFTHFEFDKIELRLKEEIERKKPITIEEAIDITEEIEISLSEGYLKQLPLKTNSILIDLYNALGEKDHTEKITAFKQKIGMRT